MPSPRLPTSPDEALEPSVQPVLIVDDDPVAAAATEGLLAAGGYRVASEARGDAVLRLVRTMFVRLVVAELYVPCAEGRCVATVLGGDRARYPRLRVILYTRHTRAEDVTWAFGVGAEAVLQQSTSPATLQSSQRSALLRQVRRLDESALGPGWNLVTLP